MGEPDANQIEDALLGYTAERLNLGKLPAIIGAAIQLSPDPERANRMLRQGASVLTVTSDRYATLVLAFSDDAEALAALRARQFDAEPDPSPEPGSPERAEVMLLGVVPASALASLPQG